MPGYRDYQELGQRTGKAMAELEDWVEPHNGSLISSPGTQPQDRVIIERIGEAAALSIVGRLHDLHDADWVRVPEHRGRGAIKTFDYQYDANTASDGSNIIQVEAKGTDLGISSHITENAAAQKARIDAKKVKIREAEKEGKYSYIADLRYGIVTGLGQKDPLHCWLTDPPPGDDGDARLFRLMSRLRFMLDWISLIRPRSPLTASLATRVSALEQVQDPFELDSNPLRNSNGEEFHVEDISWFGEVSSMFSNMSRVADGPAVGTIIPSIKNQLIFIGVQSSLFRMAATQDFESILAYRDPGGTVHKTVRCIIPRGRALRMGLDRFVRNQDANHITFNASGDLHYSQGSSVFGFVVPVE